MTKPTPDKAAPERASVLNVKVEYIADSGERPQVFAYAFGSSGKLLARAAVDEKGEARLSVPATREAGAVRVVVGPATDAPDVTAGELKRRGALEKRVRVDQRLQAGPAVFQLHPDIVACWVLGICFVRGRLVKMLGPVALPVCNATVDVYEVDIVPLIVTLPLDEIERIREEIIVRWPWPPPPPEEIPVGPIGPLPRPGPGPMPAPFAAGDAPATMALAAQSAAAGDVSRALFAARTLSGEQFRAEILKTPGLYKPLLCYILPGTVHMDLVATTTTDECGEFSTWFFRGCSNPDQPDLYFRARQPFPFIGTIQVYGPTPVSCHTYWNYKCGTEVTLITTHPLARTCAPCPDEDIPEKGVVVKRIGWTLLNQIYGASSALAANATNLGMVSDAPYDRPFGGFLHLQMNFSPALRANNIMYYQARIRRGSSGAFQPLTTVVSRYYTVWNSPPTEDAEVLGPKTINSVPNLFEIPTELGPVPNSTWSPRNPFEEYHVKIPTNDLAPGVLPTSLMDNAGKFELEISLYDNNGAPVNLAAAGVTFYVPTDDDPTPAAPLGLMDGNSFRMTLHFDNNACTANVQPPTLDMVAASPDCGILEWDDLNGLVRVNYTPYHRNGHATYSFNVMRGVSWLSLAAAAPSDALGVSGLVPSGGATYTNTQTVARLLGGCPAAGFAAELYVDSLATDGTGSELGYDARALIAFALTPDTE